MTSAWSSENGKSFWAQRPSGSILHYTVSERTQEQLTERQEERQRKKEESRESFVAMNRLENAIGPPIIHTQEATDLEFWARYQSWTFCDKCAKLEPRKLLPAFRKKAPTAFHKTCKCSKATYAVPEVDDVPLLLRTLTVEDQRILSPFNIHCGDYVKRFNGYRERTGPFRISWCTQLVQEKILNVNDSSRQAFLQQVYDFLILKEDSCYSRFILMHFRRERQPFLYEIYSSPLYRGVECALWPAIYHKTSLCESILEGQDHRASSKIPFMHKLLSPVNDYALHYDLLQYHYDRWLFKTITGAVNASKASGCSPNRSLETKSFSKTFWHHQNLYLIDAVRQYGYPSFFITISPYEWTFPFPPFLDHLRSQYAKDVTQIPALETLHVAHVLEQIARGYLTGSNCNRWRTHLFSNVPNPTCKNVLTYFYRFEFQKRGTLHLHMLVWVEDISATRADLLHASVPLENAQDAFTVASMQKSDKSCLPVRQYPDSFVTHSNGRHTIEFQHTEDDAQRHIRAYVTTLLGSLHCRTDVQLADGRALLLKYVSSYVTKMHESATSEGLYCRDVTGYQAANSFLRTVTPLEPEMVLQLSNIKVCWTDKFTALFRPPFLDQTDGNKIYKMYLKRPASENDQSLLVWLRCHQTSGAKPKPYADDRVLVGVNYVSIFNPVFFYQHLTMNFPHRQVTALRHPEEDTIPETIKHFAQAVTLTPQYWDTPETITTQFEHEGHKAHFINTIVSYIQSLHDILYLWRIRVIGNQVGDLSCLSMEMLYPLSPQQTAILADITAAVSLRQSVMSEDNLVTSPDFNWQKYRVLLGKPGTGKSQVLIRAISYALHHELSVLVAAPVALLAQGYNSIFSDDVTTDTLHGAFSIPIDGPLPNDINHRINKYDIIIVDEASMISVPIFFIMASTFNRMNVRPVVVFAGDKCQQQPLQTVNGRITSTTSIINDTATFTSQNAVIHTLHQQFRIQDPEYAAFLDLIRFLRPTQQQLDEMQHGIVLCPEGSLSDDQIWTAFQRYPGSIVMTVSRKAAQRINTIVVDHLFEGRPLSNIPCATVSDSEPIYPHRNMRVIFTENRDKAARVVNGQQATITSSHNNTIILRLPNGEKVFVYPVTHMENDRPVTRYPFTPAYAQTIIKAQGQNITHLIIWLDCTLVPPGTAYVGLSRVRRKSAISLLQPITAEQLTPVQL